VIKRSANKHKTVNAVNSKVATLTRRIPVVGEAVAEAGAVVAEKAAGAVAAVEAVGATVVVVDGLAVVALVVVVDLVVADVKRTEDNNSEGDCS
jgi:hypothetical protein